MEMRTIWALDDQEIKDKIYETEAVLIPIAARLGINSIKSELEEMKVMYEKPSREHIEPNKLKEILEYLDDAYQFSNKIVFYSLKDLLI